MSDAPLAYYRLGEANPIGAGSVADETGHFPATPPNSGITWGQPSFTGGRTAAAFASGNQGVTLPLALGVSGKPLTVELWNLNYDNGDSQAAFGLSTDSDPQQGRVQAHIPWGGTLYWDFRGFEIGRMTVNYAPYLGKWTHVVLIGGANIMPYQQIWLNGVLCNSGNTDGSKISGFSDPAIGRSGSCSHRGTLAEFALYDYALSQQQIVAHYQKGIQP